ncbi:MAG: hypothetical protein JWM78_2632 [Verrucomicrobiaceae bacterium]|nr:hypothetical protein [Verrucomicrobiaceae bacterium]
MISKFSLINKAVVAVLATLLIGHASATVVPAISIPPVGAKGFPFMSSGLDLAAYGYTENEFFIGGMAQAYVNDGDFGSDGKWNAKPNAGAIAPYKTRLLVRSPAPDKFNGTVIVEWMNVSAGMEVTPDWTMAQVELLREGYAYVGVAAQYLGVDFDRSWDGVRYASLQHPGDSFSYDIFSQAGEAILHPRDGEPKPLGDLTPAIHALIADGESQSAARMLTYVNAIHPINPVYQGFLIHSGSRGEDLSQTSAAKVIAKFFKTIDARADIPKTEKIDVPGVAKVFIRDDIKAPVLIVNSEADVNGWFGYPGFRQQADSATFRMWELAGTAHADQYVFDAGKADGIKSNATFPIECGGAPINRGPQTYAMRAAIHALNQWVRTGEPAPSGPHLQTDGHSLVRDAVTGIVTAGIKLPQVAVPIETLSGRRPLRSIFKSPFCILFGASDPWNGDSDAWDGKWLMDPSPNPEPDIHTLYPTKKDYLDKFSAALDASITAGFVRPADRDEIYQHAQAVDLWK